MARFEPVPLAYNLVEPDGGAADKPPVIILHGATSSKEDWHDNPKTVANATKRKVYVVDARNHGDSPWCDMPSFDCNVDDLLHFMDTIKAPKAILIGHSMGGMTSIKTALRFPERVEKAVMEDIMVSKIKLEIVEALYKEMDLWRKAIEVMPAGLDEKSARLFIIDFLGKAFPQEEKQTIQYDENCFKSPLKKMEDGRYGLKCNVDDILKAVTNLKEPEPSKSGKYEGPTCFIYGKSSFAKVPDDEVVIKKFFPNAELVGIEGATHDVHNDRPAEFKEALLNFLLKE